MQWDKWYFNGKWWTYEGLAQAKVPELSQYNQNSGYQGAAEWGEVTGGPKGEG